MNHVQFQSVITSLSSLVPTNHVDAVAFKYQQDNLLSKLESETSPLSANAALESFLQQERHNRVTNADLSKATTDMHAEFVGAILHRAARHVGYILGTLDLNEVLSSCGFGPGVNIGCGGLTTSAFNKMASRPTVTRELLPFASSILETVPGWAKHHTVVGPFLPGFATSRFALLGQPSPIPGGKFFTVPKNSQTDRGCEKQPIINAYLQKGIGAVMRRNFRRKAGIDLTDQSKNREAAREGSISGLRATIDLSNASNSITYWLVKNLLPGDWFHLCDIARTHCIELPDGSLHQLELFSAMGNAFTFELESIIFWAVCKAAYETDAIEFNDCLVYGDDLVVSVDVVPTLIKALTACGFTVNGAKSYWHGNFRESCGGDFYHGHEITPLKIRKIPKNAGQWCRLANLIRRTARLRGHGLYCHSAYADAWQKAAATAYSLGAAPGPMQLDGVVHVDRNVGFLKQTDRLYDHAGWRYRALEHRESSLSRSTKGHALTTLYSLLQVNGGEFLVSGSRYDLRRSTRWAWVRTEVFGPVWDVPFVA